MIHIHNGDAMLLRTRRLDLPGEQIAFRESLVTGPVVPGADWLASRARFLAEAHQQDLLRVSNSLFEQEQALDAAAAHDEIVLWFEHDLFCFVNFVYLLDRFRNRNVSFVWCADVLTGKGDGELLMLLNSRTPATPPVFGAATAAWHAYTASDPRRLNELIEGENRDLPFLTDALLLHAARFPSTGNGLGALENRLLTLIAAGATDMSMLFPQIDTEGPRYGFGDGNILHILRCLAGRATPLIIMGISGVQAPKAIFAITPAGENVLSGAVDDIAINEPGRWLGGVHLTKENVWRWDQTRRHVITSPSAG